MDDGSKLSVAHLTISGMRISISRLPSDVLKDLHAQAEAQYDVVTRAQLTRLGLSRHHVDAQLAARRWRALGPTAVALHNGPLTPQQRWSAAVLAAEGPAALAGRTAAQSGGLTGWEIEPVHIVIARGAKVNPVCDVQVKVHESRRFSADDIHPTRTPAQVRLPRAVVDAAVWSGPGRTACGIVAAAVQQRLTSVGALREVLDAAGQVRHKRILSRVLVDIEGGAQAVSELDFLRFCRRHGLPRTQLQAVRKDRHGRRRYLDATFRCPDGRIISVEIDGALHLVVSTYWQDMARLNDVVIGGRRVLRFPSAAIYADDPLAVEQLRTAVGLIDLSEPRPAIAG